MCARVTIKECDLILFCCRVRPRSTGSVLTKNSKVGLNGFKGWVLSCCQINLFSQILFFYFFSQLVWEAAGAENSQYESKSKLKIIQFFFFWDIEMKAFWNLLLPQVKSWKMIAILAWQVWTDWKKENLLIIKNINNFFKVTFQSPSFVLL